MPKNTTKRKKFTPRPKKTLTSEPNWKKLQQATTEEERLAAWQECDFFVHTEVTDREYLHSTKKWIRDHSGWDVYDDVLKIPDVHLATVGKHGWKAYKLGYIPEHAKALFKEQLFELLNNLENLREGMGYEPPIHPSLEDLDEEAQLHPKKVKQWITEWKKVLASAKKNEPLTREQTIAQTYIYNMQIYLKSGVWLDTHFGERRENRIVSVCLVPAYDKNGLIKRSVGVYYRDIGRVWQREYEGDTE